MLLAKELFVGKKYPKNIEISRINKIRDDPSLCKNKALSKKTSSKNTESWYCAVCCEYAGKDLSLYAFCGLYVRAECIGLAKEDTDLFTCLKRVQ